MRFASSLALAFAVCAGLLSSQPARADILVYTLGGTDLQFTLQGTFKVNPGKTVSFTHSKFGSLTFALEDTQRFKAPTLTQQLNKVAVKAKGNADEMFQAAVWALRHGMLDDYYKLVDKTLEIDSQHKDSLRIKELKTKMGPLPKTDDVRLEKELRDFCPKKNMKVETSAHFMLLHDTPPGTGRKSRAQQRLALLEQVYDSFLLTFFSRGIDDLEVPKERMKVVLFDQEPDFRTFSVKSSPSLINAAGYWSPINNISVFYDNGSTEQHKRLVKSAKELADIGKGLRGKVSGAKDLVRLGKALNVLVEIDRESQDVEVVSHEATHQLAGNTGLFPRNVMTPRWVHEGLAAYFESPNDATWSGIGAVNERRLTFYRFGEAAEFFSDVDYVVGDSIFKRHNNNFAVEAAYGQAWAMTHFMMSEHFDEFMKFYRRIGEMPPDILLSSETLNTLFKEVFGNNQDAIDVEWRQYMRGLKTDIDKILEGEL